MDHFQKFRATLESPIFWVDETLSTFLKTDKEKAEYVKNWFNSSVEFANDENWCHDEYPSYAELFARYLAHAALALHIGQKEEFQKHVKMLENLRQKFTGVHARLQEVTLYLLDNIKWCLKYIDYRIASEEDLRNFRKTWKNLQLDAKNQAVILCIKSFVHGYISTAKLAYYRQFSLVRKRILELDPDYHVWYHVAFLNLHGLRAISNANGNASAPSPEEIQCCLKAWKLAPNKLMSLFDYGLMLKNFLRYQVFEQTASLENIVLPFENPEKGLEECIAKFDEALAIAEAKNIDDFIIGIKMEKAETLFIGSCSDEGRAEGLNLLLDCYKACPNNALICFKLGNTYRFGCPGLYGKDDLFQDDLKAKSYFEEGLKLAQKNYKKCLQSYLKVYAKNITSETTKAAINLITVAMEIAEKRNVRLLDTYWLRIWRGRLLWNLRNEDTNDLKIRAEQDWIHVWNRFPDKQSEILMDILNPDRTFPGYKLRAIRHTELKKYLSDLLYQSDLNTHDLQAVRGLLGEIQKQALNQNANDNCGLDRNTEGNQRSNWRKPNNNVGDQIRTRNDGRARYIQRAPQDADLDDDWRRK